MNDTPSLVEGDRLYARPGNYLDEKRRLLAALGERPLPPPLWIILRYHREHEPPTTG
jgi:hypothetical protein